MRRVDSPAPPPLPPADLDLDLEGPAACAVFDPRASYYRQEAARILEIAQGLPPDAGGRRLARVSQEYLELADRIELLG
jgi:hypothetical protein